MHTSSLPPCKDFECQRKTSRLSSSSISMLGPREIVLAVLIQFHAVDCQRQRRGLRVCNRGMLLSFHFDARSLAYFAGSSIFFSDISVSLGRIPVLDTKQCRFLQSSCERIAFSYRYYRHSARHIQNHFKHIFYLKLCAKETILECYLLFTFNYILSRSQSIFF